MRTLFFDTETTGLPASFSDPLDQWPRLVQLGLIYVDAGRETELSVIVRPEGFDIPERAANVHGITTERALSEGQPLEDVLKAFGGFLKKSDLVVCHNYSFDAPIMDGEFLRVFGRTFMSMWPSYCTKEGSVQMCKIPGKYGKYKWPSLAELHSFLFREDFAGAHDALNDIRATARCFWEMKSMGLVQIK